MKTDIKFKIKNENDYLTIYTDRPEVICGVNFVYIPQNHKLIDKYKNKIKNYNEVAEAKKDIKIEGFNLINPLTNTVVDIWLSNDKKDVVMAVPAHNDDDFEFARKHNIKMIPVIEQITGTPRENEKYKQSIVAVVRNPKTNKYLTINWGKDLGGRLLIGGSINENETPLDCAVREIKEETGYKNLKFIQEIFPINHHYFAFSKNQAHNIDCTGFLFDLIDEEKTEQNLDEEEKFKVEWVEKSTIQQEIKDELHSTVFKNCLSPRAYTGDGKIINSGILNGLNKEEATNLVIKFLKENEQC